MMRLAVVLASGVALAAMAGRAQASDMFDAFQEFCVTTHAVPADAFAAADKEGWMPVPDAMLATLSKMGPFIEPQARMHSSKTGLMIFITGAGTPPDLGGAHGAVCAIASIPPVPALEQEAAAFAGVPVDLKAMDGRPAYIWTDQDGKHVQVTRRDDLKSAVQKGPVDILMAQTLEKMSLVMLAIAAP